MHITHAFFAGEHDEYETLMSKGLVSCEQLWVYGSTPQGRKYMHQHTGIPAEKILEIAHRIEMMRIPGIGPEFMRLLVLAGVTTVEMIAKADKDELLSKLTEANDVYGAVSRLPGSGDVVSWIDTAKQLPEGVEV